MGLAASGWSWVVISCQLSVIISYYLKSSVGLVRDSGKAPPANRERLALKTYLDRQSASEFINLVSHIGYDDNNVTFAC